MKLVVFDTMRLGALVEDNTIIDLNYAYAALLQSDDVARPYEYADARVPTNLLNFIEEGDLGLEAATKAIDYVKSGYNRGPLEEHLTYKMSEVKLRAPLPSLGSRIAMAGANFYDHSAKSYSMIRGENITERDIRKLVDEGKNTPWGFWKQSRNVVNPGESITYPSRTDRLDYEVEVAAIFGKKGKDIPEEEAMDYIYGYTIVLDMSCRSGGTNDRGLFLGKNFDSSVPMGPVIVTADEVGDPHKLRIKLSVDGELRQDGTQEKMIRGYPYWISFLTRDLTFYPGDIICGGTCAGTAMDSSQRKDGVADPTLFLKTGQIIESWVEKIGFMKNTIIAKE